MTLDRLTQRAEYVLTSLPKKGKRASIEAIFELIKKSSGVGNTLVQRVSKISFSKVKTVDVSAFLKEAYYQAVKLEHPYVGTEHLLLSLLKLAKSPELSRVKMELGKLNTLPGGIRSFDAAKKLPVIEMFGRNLNQESLKNLDRKIIHRDRYTSLVSALLLKESSGVLLVGERGVGKRSLVSLLARNIISLEVPPTLIGCQVIEFDLLSFVTGVLNKGGFEIGLSVLVDELKTYGRVVLSVKDFESLFVSTTAGFTIPMFYSMFKSTMEENQIKIIATISDSLYERIVSENEHILSGLVVVDVVEPSEKETLKILESTVKALEEFHNIKIKSDVIRFVYKKAKEEFTEDRFPKKAIDILDQACTHLILKKSKIPENYKKLVDKNLDFLVAMDVHVSQGEYEKASIVRKNIKGLEKEMVQKEEKIFFYPKTLVLTVSEVGESVAALKESKPEDEKVNFSRLSGLSEEVKKKIIGQDRAVDTIVRGLIRAKLGLRTKKRPLGNFLFLGPTGVGKTELAKVLAETFFGPGSLIRLDMSDFSEKHTVARLIGAPPGYVGYGEGGELTSKIATKPESVVLFDEIEKAHPDVLNILLQVMEEGELSDAKGQLFHFSKAVIILTSNLGTEILHAQAIGFGDTTVPDEKIEGRLKENLKKILKPELLNRFDDIIIFERLRKESQYKILDLLIKEVTDTLKTQNVSLSVQKDVKEFLLKEGYSKEYGARALRRTVETKLLDKIAEFLLKNKHRPLKIAASVKQGVVAITSPAKARPEP